MSILADFEILDYATTHSMISPFVPEKTRVGALSHGLGSYGYDARLGEEFGSIIGSPTTPISADHPPTLRKVTTLKGDNFVIHPGEFLLAHTHETFRLPNNVIGLVRDKSTYARLGLAVQNTVLESGWHGQVTLELSNHGPRPIFLFVGRGITQVQFHVGNACKVPYKDGFQGEMGVVVSAADIKKEKG